MLYEYRALKNGVAYTGQIDAGTQKEVADYLKSIGVFPINIREKKDSQLNALQALLQRVNQTDITYITRQFSIMLNAGLTLIDSLDIIKRQITKPPLQVMLNDINKNLHDGKTFSQSLAKYPQHFSNFYIALVKSGEASGKLDLILSKLAEHLEKQREFQQKIKNALIYPVVIVSAMLIMMFVMLTFVVPRLLELYTEFDVELPASTQFLIGVSSFLEQYWVYVIVGVVAFIFGVSKYFKTKQGKKVFDTYILRAPVFGNITKTAALVDATRTLSILISSGVSILDSLAIAVEVNENSLFQNAFRNVSKKVEKGISVGTAMANESLFPESLIQMTIVGEQTGHLDETLLKISEYYQQESELAVKGMLTLLEPMILIILGLSVGFLVMSIITPIFTLTNSFQ
ncbi:MAG: type II secretion system F family protein [Weeksellaceae bacterium]